MPSITQKITAACCLAWSSLIIITPNVWAEEPQSPAPQVMQPQVTRSAFTTAISGREPVDQLTRIHAGQQVYYFTELSGLQGRVITHKWEKDGTFQLGMQFPVGGERWRVQSSKSISPNMAGVWTVTVLNDDGTILKQDTLQVDPTVVPTAPFPIEPATPAVMSAPSVPAPTPTTSDSPTIAPSPPPQPPSAATPPAETKPIWETISH
jgi:hypothetical protein